MPLPHHRTQVCLTPRRHRQGMRQQKMARQALYTVKAACDALFGEGYSEASRKRVRRWIVNGRIKAIQDGSRFFIPRSEIAKMGGDIGQETNKLDA